MKRYGAGNGYFEESERNDDTGMQTPCWQNGRRAMTDYNTLSDFEINKRVAEAIGLSMDNGYGFIDSDGNVVCYDVISPSDGEPYAIEVRVNYCNNPSDAWPVIEGILRMGSINLDDRGGVFFPNDAMLSVIHVEGEPLRAAMIVFLMMQDGQ